MVILTLLASSSAFVATPLPQYRTHVSLPAVHLALDDVGRDRFYNYPMPPADTSKQPISPEGVEAFRERMRLRETGAAISDTGRMVPTKQIPMRMPMIMWLALRRRSSAWRQMPCFKRCSAKKIFPKGSVILAVTSASNREQVRAEALEPRCGLP